MTRINNFFLNVMARAQVAKREEGQGTVEYVLVTGLIAVVLVVGAVDPLKTAVGSAIGKVTTALA
ncbi:MAG: Flp family type IVb pilin [Dehalococcoidia bacterium]|nr:Flp family type IVb pilin [Dehalococcoidia bacterium]